MSSVLTHQQYGLDIDSIPVSEEYLTLHFSPARLPRQQRWRHYGLSADFLGDYFANFFPGEETSSEVINRRETIKASVSYIANELLENAVKYSDIEAHKNISITLYLYDHAIIVRVVNYSQQAVVHHYQRFIESILSHDLEELYVTQLERTAMGEDGSRLGLLTMMQDYGATFGWRFESVEMPSDVVCVNVVAQLRI